MISVLTQFFKSVRYTTFLHITVNWKIFELKVFHKKNLCREDFIVMGGLGKFLPCWQKGNVIEQLRNLTVCERGVRKSLLHSRLPCISYSR